MQNTSFTSAGLTLKGTFAAVEGATLSVLLISGSGQVDRDSNHKSMKTEVMKHMADALHDQGMTSFRYDKRGAGESEGEYFSASCEDNLADASAAFDSLKAASPGAKHIVIGHSDGAILATRLAAQRQDIDGIVLLAGPAQSGETIMKWQLNHVISSLKGVGKWLLKILPIDPHKQHQKLLNRLAKTDDKIIKVWGFKKLNAAWLRQFAAYNPIVDFPKIVCPVLAITGTKDIQVPVHDLEIMKHHITAPFEQHALPDLTHMLRRDPDEPTLQHYKDLIKLPLDAEMVGIIVAWVSRL